MRRVYPSLLYFLSALSICLLFSPLAWAGIPSRYTFTQRDGTYIPLVGGTILPISGASANFHKLPINFSFEYNNNTYTTFSVNSRGYIALGDTVVASSNPIADQNATNNIIAAFANSGLRPSTNGTGGELSYQTTGVIGARTLTIQWKAFAFDPATDNFDFQIILFESTNVVEIAYGASVFGDPLSSRTVYVGLRGGNNMNFNTRTTTTDWGATTTATANVQSCLISATVAPSNGLIFSWEPPSPGIMRFASSTTTTSSTAGVLKNSSDNQLIRIQVNTYGGVNNPLAVNALRLTAEGTSDLANDVSAIKVYFTGSDNVFSTKTLFGSAASLQNPITGNTTLLEGENYFWVTYDVAPGAIVGNYLDVGCDTVVIAGSGGVAPDITTPAGNRRIGYCNSGASSPTSLADIGNITFGVMSNGNPLPEFNNPAANKGYSNFYDDEWITYYTNESYPFSVRLIYPSTATAAHYIYAFIDYNQDGIFDNISEKAFEGMLESGSLSGNIAIPASAMTGITGLRIVAGNNSVANSCGSYSNGETEDYRIAIQPQPPCIAPPTAGFTTADNDTVCANASVSLGLQNNTIGENQTYQWESSPDEIGWTNIPGANTSAITVHPTTATYYRVKVSCGGFSDTSYRAFVVIKSINCFCASYSTSYQGGSKNVGKVVFGSMSNGVPANQYPPNYSPLADRSYTDYTSTVPASNYRRESNYTISVTIIRNTAATWSGWINVFIDYNQDGIFDPIAERVFNGSVAPSTPTTTGAITIPATAKLGNTQMRVVLVSGGNNTNPPCGTYSQGETEDYRINILQKLYPQDIGITRLVSPDNDKCMGATEEVTLEIKNFGTAAINYSTTPVTISGEVSGPNPAIFPPLVLNTGILNPDETQLVTIASSYDMSQSGEYVITAYTQMNGDGFLPNDTLPPTPVVNLLSGGYASVSPIVVCKGSTANLKASGTRGQFIWQKYNPVTSLWEDETGTGSNSALYSITPATPAEYRVLSCGTIASNTVKVELSPEPTFSYSKDSYCQNETDPSPVFGTNATAGKFTVNNPGLAIDRYSGVIDLSESAPGSYQVTNTVGEANGCVEDSYSFTITIQKQDDPSFRYLSSIYCLQGSDPLPQILGMPAGEFAAAPTTLTINKQSGYIDLSSSSIGQYAITYTTKGACPNRQTTDIRITDRVEADFAYMGNPYCMSASNPSPSQTGVQVRGTFTAVPAGLEINSYTGLVNLAASTQGTYTVTNKVDASGVCPAVSYNSSITITNPPIASFEYDGNPYCQSPAATNPVPVFTGGGVAGVFSSTSGLVINAATGEVNIAASTPGTYTVRNFIASEGGCSATEAVAGITINALSDCPTATVTNISGIINSYVAVSAIGCNNVTVTNSSVFHAGDRVVLMQMKGAEIDLTNSSNYGTLIDYHGAGNYEFQTIEHIAGNNIYFEQDLLKTYEVSGLVQLIKVPTYQDVVINGELSALPWNGSLGGVLVFEASGRVDFANNIVVSGMGFRGATAINSSISCSQTGYAGAAGINGVKGEGIATAVSPFIAGRGALANGGGGANGHNSGGAGGGNYNFGGGGGNQVDACPDGAIAIGGIGGKSMIYSNSVNKVFMGGGAGAGHGDQLNGTSGTNGGGIVIIKANELAGNGYSISANGSDNLAIQGGVPPVGDGAGGGGAGGSVLLACPSFSNLSISVNGGKGGNVVDYQQRTHGPGGGGSGGIIWTSSPLAGVTTSMNGGTPGMLADGTNHGAKSGEPGGALTGLVLSERFAPEPLSFSYGDNQFCQFEPNPVPVITGESGGTFKAHPSGLVFADEATGEINLKHTLPNTYTITYTSPKGCGTATITLTVVPAPVASFSYPGGNYCQADEDPLPKFYNGGEAGTFSGPAGLVIDPLTGKIDLSASTAGTYSVKNTISSSAECPLIEASSEVIINSCLNLELTLSADKSTVCLGESLTLTSTVTGGTGSIAYAWSDAAVALSGAGPHVITPGSAGTTTYTLKVSDDEGKESEKKITVIVYDIPVLSTTVTAANCGQSDGSTTLTASGGSAPYTYSFNGSSFSSTTVYTGISAGSYTVKVKDAQCEATGTVSISSMGGPTAISTTISPATCNNADGSITITGVTAGTGPYTYSFDNGLTYLATSTRNGLASGSYPVAVKDNNGCVFSRVVTVGKTGTLPVVTISGVNTICQGDHTTLTVNGGSSWLWSTGATSQSITVSPSFNTTYDVTASNGTCAAAKKPVTVTVNAKPTAAISGVSIICQNQSATLTASGGGSYTWSTGATSSSITVSPTNTTTYTVSVRDGNNCMDAETQTLTVNSNPTAAISGISIICEKESTTLTASGGTSYSWNTTPVQNTASITVSPATNTSYTVTVTDANHCTDAKSQEVTVHPIPAAPTVSSPISYCQDDATVVPLTANGTDLLWYSAASGGTGSTSAPTPATTTAGSSNYYVSQTQNQCESDRASISVRIKPLPVLVTSPSNIGGNPDTTVCINTSTPLSATGADSYSWDPANLLQQTTGGFVQTIPLAEGLYDFSVRGILDGCAANKSLQVMALSEIPAPTVIGNQHICKGEGVELTATTTVSPAKFFWYKDVGLSEIIIDQATLKTDPLFSDDTTFYTNIFYGDCASGLTNFYIKIRTLPQIAIAGSLVLCQGDVLALEGSGGQQYRWYTEQGDTVSVVPALSLVPQVDKYYLLVLDSACRSVDSVQLQINPLPPVDVGTPEIGLCLGEYQQVGSPSLAGVNYRWQPKGQLTNASVAQPNFIARNVGTGTYTLTSTYSLTGCKQSQTLLAHVYALPNAAISVPDVYYHQTPCAGEPILLSAGGVLGEQDRYRWLVPNGADGDQSSYLVKLPAQALDYTLEITNEKGCKAQVGVSLQGADCNDIGVYVPDIFSPNEDGVNETLQVRYGAGILWAKLQVFDRWGGIVYAGSKEDKPWNGTKGSDQMPEGVYVYMLQLQPVNGKIFQKSGLITLAR